MTHSNWYTAAIVLVELTFVVRAILRPHRTPASRAAWVVVIAAVPIFGIFCYLLFGETDIGRRRRERILKINAELPTIPQPSTKRAPASQTAIPAAYENLFEMAESISGFPTVSGNRAKLFSDSNETIQSLVADIHAATEHVHLLFYIWLTDNNGCRVVDAVIQAAQRGVTCRVMVDSLGSRGLIQSKEWSALQEAGVHVAVALPIGNPVLRPLFGRIDLRNHRKIVVIDNRITYCGSQNCADPEFRIKPKYAPWVDAVMRFEGPIAFQNQHLFLSDWLTQTEEDLHSLLDAPPATFEDGFPAVAFGTGPTVRNAAMPEMFVSLMYAAQKEVIITTPYYVPDESMQNALRACAHRGDDTTIIFPARNDSRVVAAASESYYSELLEAGVKIYEYPGGLLHTKSMTIDGCVTLIGSANLDRRSFDLNYENNILFYSEERTRDVRDLQLRYLSESNRITLDHVAEWSATGRLWRNAVGILGPLL